MKLEQQMLKRGETYFLSNGKGYTVVFNLDCIYDGSVRGKERISLGGMNDYDGHVGGMIAYEDIEELREATEQEKEHMKACIAAGEYVEPIILINEYNIY